jgi:chaperonin GroES
MQEITGFTPLFERVLIKPDQPDQRTETGIILPAESQKRPNTGIVMDLGYLVTASKCPVKVGDHVLYLRYAGFDVVIGADTYHLVMINDLVGIIDKTINKTFELKEYA